MQALIAIFLLCLCGCASTQKPQIAVSLLPPPVSAVKRSVVLRAANPIIMVKKPLTAMLFVYPPNATNYTWSLQASYDLKNWVTLASDMSGFPSGSYSVVANQKQQFYRMQGTLNGTNK